MLKTSQDLSKLYGVNIGQIRRWVTQGKLVPLKHEALTWGYSKGGRQLIDEEELIKRIIIEQREQIITLASRYKNSKEEIAKLRSIIVQSQEMMARGD